MPGDRLTGQPYDDIRMNSEVPKESVGKGYTLIPSLFSITSVASVTASPEVAVFSMYTNFIFNSSLAEMGIFYSNIYLMRIVVCHKNNQKEIFNLSWKVLCGIALNYLVSKSSAISIFP